MIITQQFLDKTGLARFWEHIKKYIDTNNGDGGSGAGGSASIPAGFIGIWSGSADDVPNGWHLCDGNDGTPDLRDRFVLGAGTTHKVGGKGGAETVTLTVDQMPSHSHTYVSPSYQGTYVTISTSSGSSKDSYYRTANSTTDFAGKGQSHENMPPYYALCYIIKL